MVSREQLTQLLSELAAHLGADGLALNEEGACTLVFDRRLLVEFESGKDGATLSARLGPAPEDAAVQRQMLVANALWRETSGATTALDPATGEALLLRRLEDGDLNLPAFIVVLERFVDQAEAWMRVLAGLDSVEPRAAEPPADEGQPGDEFMIRA